MFIKLSMMDDYAWRDVFESLSPMEDRKKLALISQFGDRKFSNVCQKWLHEWTKDIRIDTLRIYSFDELQYSSCCGLLAQYGLQDQFSLADTELPANICDFREIEIAYLDSKVLEFLRRMEPLFRAVNLDVNSHNNGKSLEGTRTALCHVLSLLAGRIETICLKPHQMLLTVQDLLPTQQFYGIKHLVLDVSKPSADDATMAELLHRWLGTSLAVGRPKIAELLHYSDEGIPLVLGLLERIRQYFPNETSQTSYFIHVWLSQTCFRKIQESTTQNAGTSEQLLVRKILGTRLLIGRCPSELDGSEWMVEMNIKLYQHNLRKKDGEAWRKIKIYYPTLGQIEEARREEERKDDDDDDVHQPGPSRN